MEINTGKNNINMTRYSVRDPSSLLRMMIVVLILGVSCFIISSAAFTGRAPSQFIVTAILFDLFLVGATFRLRAIWKGIILDLINNTMSFPGGDVSANDFADYFKPSFLFQYFKRFNIPLEQINQLSTKDYISAYSITFVGTFGAATVKFKNEGKRDEIYSTIRQLNKMGIPIVN